jgi:hypothetical protein
LHKHAVVCWMMHAIGGFVVLMFVFCCRKR